MNYNKLSFDEVKARIFATTTLSLDVKTIIYKLTKVCQKRDAEVLLLNFCATPTAIGKPQNGSGNFKTDYK